MSDYGARQMAAVLVTWLCCRRTVYSTHPQVGCLRCRPWGEIQREYWESVG